MYFVDVLLLLLLLFKINCLFYCIVSLNKNVVRHNLKLISIFNRFDKGILENVLKVKIAQLLEYASSTGGPESDPR